MDHDALILALQRGKLQLEGQFVAGSNATFLARISANGETLRVVYKPTRGERPLWDFPEGTLTRREVAAYQVSSLLGWELVPPTVLRRAGPAGGGSVQLFIPHNPEDHFFNFSLADQERLRPVVLFDALINNADRKSGHVFLDAERHIWLIDHGLCFHREDKLRTVLWLFAGTPIPPELLAGLTHLVAQLEPNSPAWLALKKLLSPAEIRAMLRRAKALLAAPVFPLPPTDRRPYPWPPV